MARSKKETYRDLVSLPIWNGGGGGGGNSNVVWTTGAATTWNTNVQYYYTQNGQSHQQVYLGIDPAKPKSKFGDDFDWLKKRVDEYINDFDRMAA